MISIQKLILSFFSVNFMYNKKCGQKWVGLITNIFYENLFPRLKKKKVIPHETLQLIEESNSSFQSSLKAKLHRQILLTHNHFKS